MSQRFTKNGFERARQHLGTFSQSQMEVVLHNIILSVFNHYDDDDETLIAILDDLDSYDLLPLEEVEDEAEEPEPEEDA